VSAAQFLPFVLVTLPLGVLVDRWRRHRLQLLIGADLGRCLLFAAVPLLVWGGVTGVAPLYPVVFLVGTLTVLYQVADFALLPSVVRADQLLDANGTIASTVSANEIAGRGLGGLLVQAVTAPVALVVDAVAFGLSALSLRRIEVGELTAVDEPAVPDQPARPLRRELSQGLRCAVGHRYVRPLLGEAATYNLFNELFVLGLLLWTVRDLDLGAAAVGLVFTAGGLGSFLGAWSGSRATARFGYGRVLLITMAVGNAAPLGTVVAGGAGDGALAVLAGAFVLTGVGTGVANVHAVSLRQVALPERLRGQVNAAYRLVSWGVVPLGAAAGGLAAGHVGAYATMVVGAAGVATSTLWVALSSVPRLRHIDDARVPEPTPEPSPGSVLQDS